MKTSLATIRCQNMTWSHCEILSPTNLANLSEHSNWEPWTDCKSNKMFDILGIPKISESLGSLGNLGTLEPWNLGNPAEPSETFGNSWNLQESGTLRKPLEPRNPVAHWAFCAVHLSNPLSAIPLESLRLRILWGNQMQRVFVEIGYVRQNSMYLKSQLIHFLFRASDFILAIFWKLLGPPRRPGLRISGYGTFSDNL